MISQPTLEEFKQFKEKVDNFCRRTFSAWDSRLLFEAAEDREFMNFIATFIDKAKTKLSYTELDALFSTLKNAADEALHRTQQENNLDKKFDFVNRTMALMGFIECMNEDSTLPEQVLSDIKEKKGNGYLLFLQELDKKFFSDDVKKLYGIDHKSTEWPEDEDIRKYLVLKKWQDIQHHAFVNEFEKDAWSYEFSYAASKEDRPFFPEKVPYVYTNRAVKIRALLNMSTQNLISIDKVAVYYLCGLDKELIKLFGGKAYGLIKLRASGAKIPETFLSPVTCTVLEQKDFDKLPANTHFAIRSSADIEDGDKHSFAGMFESVLDVSKDDIQRSFNVVKASVASSRVSAYVSHHNLTEPHMGIVVQVFREPEYAGVWMGTGNGKGILEWVKGNGEKLVSGVTTPMTERWDSEKVSNPLSINQKPIAEILMDLQSSISETKMADFEWCILDGKLVMLQYRPVTTKISATMEKSISENGLIKGLPASAGEIEGPAKFLYTVDETTAWQDGNILISRFTSPEWMNVLTKVGGVVTAFGGLLSHTAIVARELGIPCVVGIGYDGLNKIKDEKFLKVDGNHGIVIVKNNSSQQNILFKQKSKSNLER